MGGEGIRKRKKAGKSVFIDELTVRLMEISVPKSICLQPRRKIIENPAPTVPKRKTRPFTASSSLSLWISSAKTKTELTAQARPAVHILSLGRCIQEVMQFVGHPNLSSATSNTVLLRNLPGMSSSDFRGHHCPQSITTLENGRN